MRSSRQNLGVRQQEAALNIARDKKPEEKVEPSIQQRVGFAD